MDFEREKQGLRGVKNSVYIFLKFIIMLWLNLCATSFNLKTILTA